MDRRAVAVIAAFVLVAVIALVALGTRPPADRPMPVVPGHDYSASPTDRVTVPVRVLLTGADQLSIHGCGGEAYANADGVAELAAQRGTCELQPGAEVARFHLVGASVAVTIDGTPLDLAFEPIHAVVVDADDAKRTRLLVSFAPTGLRVESIDESDAERLSLHAGDVITAIAGVDLAALPPIERLRLADPLADSAPGLTVAPKQNDAQPQ